MYTSTELHSHAGARNGRPIDLDRAQRSHALTVLQVVTTSHLEISSRRKGQGTVLYLKATEAQSTKKQKVKTQQQQQDLNPG